MCKKTLLSTLSTMYYFIYQVIFYYDQSNMPPHSCWAAVIELSSSSKHLILERPKFRHQTPTPFTFRRKPISTNLVQLPYINKELNTIDALSSEFNFRLKTFSLYETSKEEYIMTWPRNFQPLCYQSVLNYKIPWEFP